MKLAVKILKQNMLKPSIVKSSRFIISAILLLAAAAGVSAQGIITGRVTGAPEGRPLSNAAVIVDGVRGVTTGNDGRFLIEGVPAGTHSVEARILGYIAVTETVTVKDGGTVTVDFALGEDFIDAGAVVVTANRGASRIADVPSRVTLISSAAIASRPAATVDEMLSTVPGLNISRSFGIFSHKSSVTMRGLSGNEQARVLVMIDGVPVNKSDGGSVNWNLLDPAIVERIEVVKGPASSMYGSNAMGGAINIITRRPSGALSGRVTAGYGTYNTFSGRASLGQKLNPGEDKGFYYMLNGFYRQSDGYITQSEFDQAANPYVVASDMQEYSASLKTGYNFRKGEFLEADLIAYNDRRGTGELVWQPHGNTTDHDTWQFRTRYSLERDRLSADVSFFWLKEDYRKVNEYLKDDYTWYNVLSERVDAGFLSSVSWKAGNRHSLSAGIDLKAGSVDAADVYYTSTDIVYNRGKMLSSGVYLQDAFSIVPERLALTAGIRYDLSMFRDGAFFIDTPSAETVFMRNIEERDMDNVTWGALSPKLALNYTPSPATRIYFSAGRGFRPSVLDDLCRSGRIRGGFKLASPDASPEYLANIEAGADFALAKKLRASLSAWYSQGRDFLYYVNTGDSIDMGYGLRPILVRTNIPLVEISGAEAELSWPVTPALMLSASYGYSYSVISDYRPLVEADPIDLTGNHLTDVPSSTMSLSARWNNRFVNAGLVARYQGAMWANDQNIFDEVIGSDRYPAYTIVDLKLSRVFLEKISVDLGVQNILDTKFYDSKGAVCPGRFITLELGYIF
ncbi:MAG: TonB-dependent receptor [Bacteroidales bacterium]|jgi:iron complex outermembrane receptor protein|nr:TonB-dependent receptor [Bacteroidales bacterium]